MIKALIFDFDGLIIDSESPEFEAWHELFAEYGRELGLELWADLVGRPPTHFDLYGYFCKHIDPVIEVEQQLRAVCGLPLGSPELLRPAAMANLLGDLWPPHWESALAMPDVKLHLYGKTEARAGRKMGHLTAMAGTAEEAALRVRAARRSLTALE